MMRAGDRPLSVRHSHNGLADTAVGAFVKPWRHCSGCEMSLSSSIRSELYCPFCSYIRRLSITSSIYRLGSAVMHCLGPNLVCPLIYCLFLLLSSVSPRILIIEGMTTISAFSISTCNDDIYDMAYCQIFGHSPVAWSKSLRPDPELLTRARKVSAAFCADVWSPCILFQAYLKESSSSSTIVAHCNVRFRFMPIYLVPRVALHWYHCVCVCQ